MKIVGNKAYAIGLYDFVGPNTGSLVMLNPSDQSLLPTSNCPYFEIDGNIFDIVGDGKGNAIIAGDFNYIQGIKRKSIAKVKADCTLDTSFDVKIVDASAEIRTLLVHNQKLYFGGNFASTFPNNVSRVALAVANLDTGAIDEGFNAGLPSGELYTMQTDGSSLVVGGSFSIMNGNSVANLARIDVNSGAFLTTLGEPDNKVGSIILDGNEIIVCGSFTNIDSQTANYLARIDYAGGLLWGSNLFDSSPASIHISNGKLFVGGAFSTPRPGLVTLNPGSGNDLNTDFKLASGNITKTILYNNKLYVFGFFDSILDKSITGLAVINPSNETVETWDAKLAGGNISFLTGGIFQFANGPLLLGGSFASLQGVKRSFLSEIDLTTGKPTDWNPQITYPGGGIEAVQALEISENRLFIAGTFTAIDGITRTRFASFDLLPSPKLNSLNISISGYTNTTNKIVNINGTMFVGGGFTNVSGNSINHFFSLNPNTFALSFANNPNPNFPVSQIHKLSNGKFFIGGEFSTINGSTATNRFAIIDETNGSFKQGPSGSAIGLLTGSLTHGDKIFVGFGNQAAPNGTGCCVGIYDIQNLSPISHNLGIAPQAGSEVRDMIVDRDHLLLSGAMITAQDTTISNFARFDLASLRLLVDSSIAFNSPTFKFVDTASYIYVMGRFKTAAGRRRGFLARISKDTNSIID
ncbi:hypothetical protein LPTSP4_19060 [Leptospira ryugenii]|uniref:Uncharacterized protein n=1 Tax=Leptospira ryugenii TaxID=1917863 RepID=A0A2P2E0I0_9LEPT|nr:hypothetical protein [Leptospira ryugenii]GBF50381.1 hypothetical protein LPTSP4_19060 [Leptospira ryugenii]